MHYCHYYLPPAFYVLGYLGLSDACLDWSWTSVPATYIKYATATCHATVLLWIYSRSLYYAWISALYFSRHHYHSYTL